MPKYIYTAKSLEGKEEKGEIIANNKKNLSRILKDKGLFLIMAKEEKGRKEKKEIILPFFSKVPLSEKIVFTRNLQVMISAGISLPRALKGLSGQTKNAKFKKVLEEISEKINKGESFSASLSQYSDIFSDLFQNMIKVAEEAGTLGDVLGILADQMEKKNNLAKKIKGAMLYPIVIITAMLGIGILMLIVVIPKLSATFEDLGVELPLTTRIVIGFGNFLAERWYFAIIIAVVLFFSISVFAKSKKGKKILDFSFLKIPIIGQIIKNTNTAYTARTLGSLLVSGVPIVRSLEITSGTLTNSYFQNAITEISEKVRKGEKLSISFKPYNTLYPDMMLQMIEVGEETGKTSDVLDKVANFFEEEVADVTKNLSSVIEPFLMIIIGAAVGFFAVSMIQPMYSMMGTL